MLIRFLVAFVIILTMYGCQSTQKAPGRAIDLSTLDAYQLLREAQSQSGAAAEARLRVQAAEVFIFNRQYSEALSAIESLQVDALAPAQREAFYRISAQAWFGFGDLAQAEQALAALTDRQPTDLLLLAEICESRRDYRCSADAYIEVAIELGLDATELPEDIHDRIWLALSRAGQAPTVFSHRYHHGWWLLQEQIRTAGSITGQLQAWRTWQSAYPSHPARLRPPQALRQLEAYQTPQVGLLLPLSGPYASAGIAVRDGLIAAYLGEKTTDKPQIKIYDTGATALPVLFERALADGADVLVGPLLKEEVEQFAALTQFTDTPRLVLNYLSPPGTTTPGTKPTGAIATATNPFELANTGTSHLFQFGIAIEDEATSLANHVLLQGLERLLIVHSQARWSQRAFSAYTNSWPYPVISANFADIKSLTGAVGEAMQVAASDTRRKEIANILGEQLEFLPRAREDLDGVIALTTQVESLALIPALRFHFADNLPVYATSQAARGQDLADLNDFKLTEMPIFAAPDAAQQTLHDAFGLSTNPFAELYAMGFDAYRIATWLPILTPESQVALPAASGYLWLEGGGIFRRDLTLSRITDQGDMVPTQ